MTVKVKKMIDVLDSIENFEKLKEVSALYKTPFTIDKACEHFNLQTDDKKFTLYGYNGDIYMGVNQVMVTRSDNVFLKDKFYSPPERLGDLIDHCIDAGIVLCWRKVPLCLQ